MPVSCRGVHSRRYCASRCQCPAVGAISREGGREGRRVPHVDEDVDAGGQQYILPLLPRASWPIALSQSYALAA